MQEIFPIIINIEKKTVVLLNIFVETVIHLFIILWWRVISKEQHLKHIHSHDFFHKLKCAITNEQYFYLTLYVG